MKRVLIAVFALTALNSVAQVGIGTTSPSALLHVTQPGDGTATLNGTSPNLLLIESTANSSSSGLIFKAANSTGSDVSFALGINPNFQGGSVLFTDAAGNGLFGGSNNPSVAFTARSKFGIGTYNPSVELYVNGTGAIRVPVGTTAQRPASPTVGMIRYNSSTGKYEGYTSSGWVAFH